MPRLKALGIPMWNLGSDINIPEVQSSAMFLTDVWGEERAEFKCDRMLGRGSGEGGFGGLVCGGEGGVDDPASFGLDKLAAEVAATCGALVLRVVVVRQGARIDGDSLNFFA